MADDPFPPTKLRTYRDALIDDLYEEEPTAIAEWHARDPKLILHRVNKDLATVERYPAIDEDFHPRDGSRRDPLESRVSLAEVISTFDFVTNLAGQQTHPVVGDQELAFRYIDREIFSLRQREGEARPASRKLDLLLVSDDGLPIVGELKIREDTPTYPAFIQCLMYAVELSNSSQRARLAKYYPDAGFEWPKAEPFGDIYLIAFEPPKGAEDKNRARSFAATEKLAEALVQRPKFAVLVRRIVYLEASIGPDGLVFEPRFRFDS